MDLTSYVGQQLYPSYKPGYIVLSYVISLTGCWTTLELLRRRTSSRGWYNWWILIGSAFSMGAVAIWCMHFIGNRSIQIRNGEPGLQISYNAKFTALSFFIPICVVGLAFYYFGKSEKVTVLEMIAGGVLTGLAICGMHYTGQGGISNYIISYSWKYVLGSVFVAVVASTAALGVFFYSTMTWTSGFITRSACAAMMAAAVTGMHFVATLGTYYHFKMNTWAGQGGLSREAVVIVVLCLGIGCCILSLILAALGQQSRKRATARAQQVALACAFFDFEGKLMVNPQGLVPGHKVTNSYMERSFESVFDVGHPVFCWIFQASRCWYVLKDFVDEIRTHLRAASTVKTLRPESHSTYSDLTSFNMGDGAEDYSLLFKELFCLAAYDLAHVIQLPLEQLGVLYNGIFNTGTVRKPNKKDFVLRSSAIVDLENFVIGTGEKGGSSQPFGRGQVLFLVRRLGKSDLTHMQSIGFRFAAIDNILESLADTMQVTKDELRQNLENLRRYAEEEYMLEPGIHLACFALRPLYQRGFDVLVRQEARNLLPSERIPLTRLDKWHFDFLSRMENWTLATCRERLRTQFLASDVKEQGFADQLLEGITGLAKQIDSPFIQDARLVATPLKVPCSVPSESHTLGFADVIAFQIIVDAHSPNSLKNGFEFAPFRFFLTQQRVYSNSSHNGAVARKIHKDLAGAVQSLESNHGSSPASSPRKRAVALPRVHVDFKRHKPQLPAAGKKWCSGSVCPSLSVGFTHGSSREAINLPRELSAPTLGGIHVSNEISVDISTPSRMNSIEIIEEGLGLHSEASVIPDEEETFADKLLEITIRDRRKQRSVSVF